MPSKRTTSDDAPTLGDRTFVEDPSAKAERMTAAVGEAAARVPTFAHTTYHPDRYSPAGARKARGHRAGARRRPAKDVVDA